MELALRPDVIVRCKLACSVIEAIHAVGIHGCNKEIACVLPRYAAWVMAAAKGRGVGQGRTHRGVKRVTGVHGGVSFRGTRHTQQPGHGPKRRQ